MNETLEYIDSYFAKSLPPGERVKFESRCASDEAFAMQVAEYVSARSLIARAAEDDQRLKFELLHQQNKKTEARRVIRFTLSTIAAAATVFLFVVYFIQPGKKSLQQYADAYTATSLRFLSPSLSGGTDTIELAKKAYNTRNYDQAIAYLQPQLQNQILAPEALEYLGLSYLAKGNTEEALQRFEQLASIEGLQRNAGTFYAAIALLKRNKTGDEALAKAKLEVVIKNGLAGTNEAKQWLQ